MRNLHLGNVETIGYSLMTTVIILNFTAIWKNQYDVQLKNKILEFTLGVGPSNQWPHSLSSDKLRAGINTFCITELKIFFMGKEQAKTFFLV